MESIKGIISEVFNEEDGIIKDQNNQDYYFSRVNFEDDFEPEIGIKVLFDFMIIETENEYKIYKAYNIKKDNL